jgi:hypothetical protein
VTAYELAFAILGIPGSIFGVIQLWQYLLEQGWVRRPTSFAPTAPPPKDPNRVLLHFDVAHMDQEGTWEYEVASFCRRLPRSYRIIESPTALRTINETKRHWTTVFLLIFSAGLCWLLGTLLYFDQRPYTGLTQRAADAVFIAAVGLGLVGAFLHYRKHWRASRVIEEYRKFFETRGYDIDLEFTQSKAKYDSSLP